MSCLSKPNDLKLWLEFKLPHSLSSALAAKQCVLRDFSSVCSSTVLVFVRFLMPFIVSVTLTLTQY